MTSRKTALAFSPISFLPQHKEIHFSSLYYQLALSEMKSWLVRPISLCDRYSVDLLDIDSTLIGKRNPGRLRRKCFLPILLAALSRSSRAGKRILREMATSYRLTVSPFAGLCPDCLPMRNLL
jgi:hypothetical protein